VERRTLIVVLTGILVALLFAAISTAGPVPLADGPPNFLGDIEAQPAVIEVEIESEVAEVVEREETEPSPLIEAIVRGVFYAILTIGAVLAAAYLWRHRPSLAWARRLRRGDTSDFDVLADVATTVSADAARQQAALRRGRPRNAIVECWLRLEAAVTAAGVERDPSDTSAEFTERVLAAHHVDPTALSTLAALYREARFSDHEMGEDARRAAIDALDTVHAELGRRRSAVTR
jgi:hypothetical protein